jgi:uncharacterized membrane protein YphA (DoxX/SURF4 family)
MDSIKDLLTKLNQNQQLPYALIRIFLGVALLIRGVIIFSNPNAIIELIDKDQLFIWYAYIAIAHMIGGILIAVGFFTRLGALIQTPILLSAVFMFHAKGGLMMGGQSLELAVIVLFLLCIYFVFGPGKYSVNYYFKKDF